MKKEQIKALYRDFIIGKKRSILSDLERQKINITSKNIDNEKIIYAMSKWKEELKKRLLENHSIRDFDNLQFNILFYNEIIHTEHEELFTLENEELMEIIAKELDLDIDDIIGIEDNVLETSNGEYFIGTVSEKDEYIHDLIEENFGILGRSIFCEACFIPVECLDYTKEESSLLYEGYYQNDLAQIIKSTKTTMEDIRRACGNHGVWNELIGRETDIEIFYKKEIINIIEKY